ncbi:hypothetical protein ACTXT7_002939 [Hymenolepis weldensis]
MIDETPGKSVRYLAKDLQVSEGTIIYKESEVISLGGQTTIQENRLMRAKGLLKKLKHSEEQDYLWFFSDEKKTVRMKKPIEEMIGGYVRADPTKAPTLMSTKFPPTVMTFSVISSGLRVNADAYVVTLQAIVIKPPWIDCIVNGGRPHVFEHDSAPSYKALKTQN